jgi:hypothetical protein
MLKGFKPSPRFLYIYLVILKTELELCMKLLVIPDFLLKLIPLFSSMKLQNLALTSGLLLPVLVFQLSSMWSRIWYVLYQEMAATKSKSGEGVLSIDILVLENYATLLFCFVFSINASANVGLQLSPLVSSMQQEMYIEEY